MLFDSMCVACAAAPGPVCRSCEAAMRPAPAAPIVGIDACTAGFELDPAVREMVAALKYRRQRRLAGWFATRLMSFVPRGADVMTWLPATPARKRRRGFDQAEELARELSRNTHVPAVELLTRHCGDQRQTGQTRAARLAGPQLAPVGASPDFVVIVDDILTTGSSLRVAAQTLRQAGARRIVAVTIAATPPKRDICLHDLPTGCSVHEWT